MRAVVLREPGPVENLELTDLPLPEVKPGWVRIAVRAFGINRSELHTRLGLAEGVTFPRVPGIEAVGVVDAGGDFEPGQQVEERIPRRAISSNLATARDPTSRSLAAPRKWRTVWSSGSPNRLRTASYWRQRMSPAPTWTS